MDLKTYTATPGAASKLAKRLGIAQALVSQWTANSDPRPIPVARCPDIERETAGGVTCEEMRPDAQWVRVKDRKWPHPNGRPLLDVAKVAA